MSFQRDLIERDAPTTKPSNPKDAIGCTKVPYSTVPTPVVAELAVAMFEGGLKYGRHNYRAIGVRSSIYYDAALRHLTAWWEGEDIDPDSGLSHITKAISSLAVLRDAQIRDMVNDDRPPATFDFVRALNRKTKALADGFEGDPVPPFIAADHPAGRYSTGEPDESVSTKT